MVTYAAMASAGMVTTLALDIENRDARSYHRKQQDSRPEIDDVICQYLDGSELKNALNFIDYVRNSKMKIKWSAANVWSVRYKRKHVLDIVVNYNCWSVRLAYDHIAENSIFSKRDRDVVVNLIGNVKNTMPENVETIPALS